MAMAEEGGGQARPHEPLAPDARMLSRLQVIIEISQVALSRPDARDIYRAVAESIVRDLVDAGVQLVREERGREVKVRAERAAEDRIVDLLLVSSGGVGDSLEERRRALKRQLREGLLEERELELEVSEQRVPTLEMFTPQGMESMGIDLKDMFGGMFGR